MLLHQSERILPICEHLLPQKSNLLEKTGRKPQTLPDVNRRFLLRK